MEDAAGQLICFRDTVVWNTTQHGGRGFVIGCRPGLCLLVHCLDGQWLAIRPSDVTVTDRTAFDLGSSVALASDPGGQAGVVTGVTTEIDLARLHSDQHQPPTVLARGVSPSQLQRVRGLGLADYVVSGPWLGCVAEVSHDVDVLFDDGALCRVARAEGKLQDADRRPRKTHINFYPGRRVVGDSSTFKASRWLRGHWKPSLAEGTVAKVEMAGVLVYWVASSELGADRRLVQAAAPPAYQPNPSNLTFFAFDHTYFGTFGVGHRCFFRTSGGGGDVGGTAHDHGSSSSRGVTRTYRNWQKMGVKRRWRADRRRAGEFERAMSVVDTRTTVDVLWQDGTRQCGMASTSLVPFVGWSSRDFFPGQRVTRRTPTTSLAAIDAHGDGDETGPATRVGVIRSLDCKDQTARVSWLKEAATCPPGDLGEIECDDEILSTYDVVHVDQSSRDAMFYGYFVVHLRQTESIGNGQQCGEVESMEGPKPVSGEIKNKEEAMLDNDLSWVGRIVGLGHDCHDGRVQVKWGDGNVSRVLPHEIAIIKETFDHMHAEMEAWAYEDEGNDDTTVHKTQEDTPQEPTAANNNNDEGKKDDNSSDESDDEDGGASTSRTNLVTTAIQAATRLAREVLSKGKRYLMSGVDTNNIESAMPLLNAAATSSGDGAEQAEMEANATTSTEKSFQFSQFDVVQSPSDHHYLDIIEEGTGGGRKWTKRVQKEWKILENNLPDTIYVRAFEDRMDLLRAVMVGAAGTPYQDGLFFFDLQLPPSYPAAPPLVNYRSFGLRVNPNLYESGTVCLSLLNTFGGEGAELWSPEASTVLQVIVSIQGLVLTAQPYYNEAGYAAQVGTAVGHRNELPYGENAYLLNLQTMLHLLRRPPVGFEEFVGDHFRRRGRHVLQACEAYMGGCLVGTLDEEAHVTGGSRERQCSAGFRLALAHVVPRLTEAFDKIGTDEELQEHVTTPEHNA
ncbi:hypothetical protein ACP4OV_023289 [Aristida adscensionis]